VDDFSVGKGNFLKYKNQHFFSKNEAVFKGLFINNPLNQEK
jgi:hypothetical protein